MLKLIFKEPVIRTSAICISWFWFLGANYLTQFPNIAKNIFFVNEEVITLFITLFTFGVATGSLVCNRLLRGKISTRLSPYAAAALVVFGADFYLAAKSYMPEAGALGGIRFFLAQGFVSYRLILDLLLTAIAGGIFYVPFYAKVQASAPTASRARIMAGISFLNAVFMVFSSVLGGIILFCGFSGLEVLLSGVLLTIPVIWYCKTP